MNVEDLDPLVQFVEELGLSTEEDGMPRIAGRILGLLLVEEGPFQFDELAERLKVSRASVSTNTRLLERISMIERFTVPGERKDFFRLADDLHGRLLESSLKRLQHRQGIIERCLNRLNSKQDFAAESLSSMNRFYGLAIESTQDIIDRWRTEETTEGVNTKNGSAQAKSLSSGAGR